MKKHAFIGVALNKVNPFYYGGWGGELTQTHNDLNKAIYTLCKPNTKTIILKDELATIETFMIELLNLNLRKGDLLDIYYSGHGTNVPDTNNDEEDLQDEAYCFYNGLLLDDSLNYFITTRLDNGITIRLWSDCCHSGSISRDYNNNLKPKHIEYQRSFRVSTLSNVSKPLVQKVYSISACMDHEVAYEGSNGGVFTEAFTTALNANKNMTFNKLRKELTKVKGQTPMITGYNLNFLGMYAKVIQ